MANSPIRLVREPATDASVGDHGLVEFRPDSSLSGLTASWRNSATGQWCQERVPGRIVSVGVQCRVGAEDSQMERSQGGSGVDADFVG